MLPFLRLFEISLNPQGNVVFAAQSGKISVVGEKESDHGTFRIGHLEGDEVKGRHSGVRPRDIVSRLVAVIHDAEATGGKPFEITKDTLGVGKELERHKLSQKLT
jgi:hypothetical protein